MHYSRPSDFEHLVLKEDSQTVVVGTSEACRLAALSMVRQATRRIDIVSRHLDPQIYDDRGFCEAVSQMILGSRRARVRALIHYPNPVVKHGHRLVTLNQQLSSFIEMRVPAREFDEYNAAFLIADRTGVIYRMLSDGFEGTANFNDPHTAQELAREFDEMWQTAVPDVNLRRSYL